MSLAPARGTGRQAQAFAASPVFALASLPVLAFFAVFIGWLLFISVLKPAVFAVYTAEFTLENYVKVFTSRIYYEALLRSIWLSALSTVFTVLVAYPIAYHICRRAGRLKGAYIAIVASVFLVTFVIKIYAWQILLERAGLVDRLLQLVGLVSEPTRLIGTGTGILIGLVYASLPYMILSLVTAIEKVPRDVEHAAACAGAAPNHVFRTVTLPLTMPGIVTGALFTFALNVAAFIVPALLGGGTITMAGLLIQRVSVGVGTAGGNWPLAAALSVVLLAVSALFSLGLVRVFSSRRWRLAA
ncbi:Putative spermidine/putrescine transport system permease protein [Hyphomicrobiales bacterium]|nr:Putative spermidine/putrescine transport system permease protein [Hyphomicrobiales bacterium]CAH1689445.1 putative spermidine/putrescine transport system permease protein [Hyphomicrobiales bacterium]